LERSGKALLQLRLPLLLLLTLPFSPVERAVMAMAEADKVRRVGWNTPKGHSTDGGPRKSVEVRPRYANGGAMPFGHCTLRKRLRLHLKYAQRQLLLTLPFKSPLSAP
jgi:hypothetical protein